MDLVADLEFFDVLTKHYQQECEAAPDTMKGRIMAKIF